MTNSGSDTDTIRRFRQGIYAYGLLDRQRSLPIIGPEVDSFFLTASSFGQSKNFPDNVPFQDIANFDPVAFVADEQSNQVFPAILGNVNIQDPFQMDGVLEPLTIRAKIARASIDYPHEAHDVRGLLCGGNENPWGRTDQVFQYYPTSPPLVVVPWIESDTTLGSSAEGAIKLPGYHSELTTKILPYIDKEKVHTSSIDVTIRGDAMIAALRAMTGSQDPMIPENHRSAGAGFTYPENVFGTDSLAFGGLKK